MRPQRSFLSQYSVTLRCLILSLAFPAWAGVSHLPRTDCRALLKTLLHSQLDPYKVGTPSRLPEWIREKLLGDSLPRSVHRLGSGAEGTVYRVEPLLGESFTVKVFQTQTAAQDLRGAAEAFRAVGEIPKGAVQLIQALEVSEKEGFIKYVDTRGHPLNELLKSGLSTDQRAELAQLYHRQSQKLANALRRKGWRVESPEETTEFGTYLFFSPESQTPQKDTFRIVPRNLVMDLETGTLTLIDRR